jgi:hypothetical protein
MKKPIQEYIERRQNGEEITNEEDMIEFVCDVAEDILEDNHPHVQHYVVEDCGISRFTPQSQDLFGGYYDAVRKVIDP